MSDYLISGMPPGAGGVGRFLKRLIPEARRAGWEIMCRPERPARGVVLHALKLLVFYVRIRAVRNRDVIVIHPQTLRWGTFFRLCRANRVALLVVDNSFFCIRSYNYRGQRWSECLDCLGNISECHPDCMPFPVSYRRQDNLEYLERLKMLAPKIRFLVQNPGQGRLIRDHFGLDVDVRQVGMVTDEFMVEPSAATGTSGVDIVFHGNLNRPKGFEYALELARNLPDLSFLFPGDPEMMPVDNGEMELPENARIRDVTWETGLREEIENCQLVLCTSMWSAPVEGALVKSLLHNGRVAVFNTSYGYQADLPEGLVVRLDHDLAVSAGKIREALGKEVDTAGISRWISAYLEKSDPALVFEFESSVDRLTGD